MWNTTHRNQVKDWVVVYISIRVGMLVNTNSPPHFNIFLTDLEANSHVFCGWHERKVLFWQEDGRTFGYLRSQRHRHRSFGAIKMTRKLN